MRINLPPLPEIIVKLHIPSPIAKVTIQSFSHVRILGDEISGYPACYIIPVKDCPDGMKDELFHESHANFVRFRHYLAEFLAECQQQG